MKKTYVISGCAGFIGSHLVEFYLNKGYKVVGIDNLITGNINNLKPFEKNQDFLFIKHDISKPLLLKGKISSILHFASLASPVDYINYPIQTLKVGAVGTLNMLGMAKDHKASIILASTSEVYGDPLEHPQKETYWGNVNPVGPRGVYDESKRFAESLMLAYHRKHGIDTKIVRIFNTYGPRMRLNDGRVVPNFISQALTNKNISVYGKGQQTRSFCYVSDLVEGINRLLNSKYHFPVNLGNPSEMTILQLAKLLIKLTVSKSKIIYEKLPDDDPKLRQPDIALARRLLKWVPAVSVEDGMKMTIDYFKNLMKNIK